MVVRPPLALSTALMALGALLAVAACAEEGPDTPPIDQNGTVGGRVLMTLDGPLVGAAVSIDHPNTRARRSRSAPTSPTWSRTTAAPLRP